METELASETGFLKKKSVDGQSSKQEDCVS